MKKFLVIVFAMAVACICLVGCGSSDFEGKWECVEMSGGGMTVTEDLAGEELALRMQFEFNSDGKGVRYEYADGKSKKWNFTWEADGKTCKIKGNNKNSIEFKLEDGKLVDTFTTNGTKFTVKLKKVDEFTKPSK